ncbi:hypothetical protein [Roseibium album]|uniref:hypothetical protein n=1 Tax=Roseibium album TaxID=311410 RepID=UPI00391D31C2
MLKPFSSRFVFNASAGDCSKACKTRQDRRTGTWQLSSDSWIDNGNPAHGCYRKGEGLNITETDNKQVADVNSICEPVVGRVKRGILQPSDAIRFDPEMAKAPHRTAKIGCNAKIDSETGKKERKSLPALTPLASKVI